MGKIIAFTSCKGGCGTTWLTAALGHSLSLLPKKTCVVDMNIGMRALDLTLGVQDRVVFDLYDLCMESCTMEQALLRIRESLFMIAAPVLDVSAEMTGKCLKHGLERLRKRFDFVLLDLPVACHPWAKTVSALADQTILISVPGSQSSRNLERACALLREEKGTSLSLLMNQYDRGTPPTGLPGFIAQAEYLDLPLIGAVPFRSVLLERDAIDLDAKDFSGAFGEALHDTALRLNGSDIPIVKTKKWRLPWHS